MITMFRGRSKHTLDDKGRLAIPTRFREVLTQKEDEYLILTNHDNCLWAFTRENWDVIETKIASLPLFDPAVNTFRRYFISGAQECPLKQGRITIPPDLREIAGLKKEVELVGQTKLFEIWARERWEEEFQRAHVGFREASQTVLNVVL